MMQARANIRPRPVSRRQALATIAASVVFHRHGAGSSARQTQVEGTLLVRGETELPGSQMAWRVVQDVAEVGLEAGFQRRALGFTVNSSIFTDLLLTDAATGSAYRLAPGEAAFVDESIMQLRESLGSDAEQYLRIALVQEANAGDAGGDRMVFAGPVFAAPAGQVTLSLERFDLDAGDRAYAVPGPGQALILVLQGEVESEEGEGGPQSQLTTVVGSGTSYAALSTPWGTSLTATRDATFVLVASIQ